MIKQKKGLRKPKLLTHPHYAYITDNVVLRCPILNRSQIYVSYLNAKKFLYSKQLLATYFKACQEL